MGKLTTERRNYILNNLLLFIEHELEEAGVTKDSYWFECRFEQERYLMGVPEPKIEPPSRDTQKFLNICPCAKDELEAVIKYGIAHEYLTRFRGISCKITYLGMNLAEDYEENIEGNDFFHPLILKLNCVDKELLELVEKSRYLYYENNLQGAVEKIWDALERSKTILNDDKKKGAKELCELCAGDLDSDIFNNEYVTLTNIGNNYQIRHFETSKKAIEDEDTLKYLYFRAFALVNYAVSKLNSQQTNQVEVLND